MNNATSMTMLLLRHSLFNFDSLSALSLNARLLRLMTGACLSIVYLSLLLRALADAAVSDELRGFFCHVLGIIKTCDHPIRERCGGLSNMGA
jgi:hypothetical protein